MMMREKITHPEWEVAGARAVSCAVFRPNPMYYPSNSGLRAQIMTASRFYERPFRRVVYYMPELCRPPHAAHDTLIVSSD